jgi:hypothetical protein
LAAARSTLTFGESGDPVAIMDFCLIPTSELDERHFHQWPVWSEYYEPDEIEEITSWGIQPEQFHEQLRALRLGNEHAAYPVLIYDRFRNACDST